MSLADTKITYPSDWDSTEYPDWELLYRIDQNTGVTTYCFYAVTDKSLWSMGFQSGGLIKLSADINRKWVVWHSSDGRNWTIYKKTTNRTLDTGLSGTWYYRRMRGNMIKVTRKLGASAMPLNLSVNFDSLSGRNSIDTGVTLMLERDRKYTGIGTLRIDVTDKIGTSDLNVGWYTTWHEVSAFFRAYNINIGHMDANVNMTRTSYVASSSAVFSYIDSTNIKGTITFENFYVIDEEDWES